MQQVTVTFQFKVEHTPSDPAHLQHIVEQWAQSKGALLEDGVINI